MTSRPTAWNLSAIAGAILIVGSCSSDAGYDAGLDVAEKAVGQPAAQPEDGRVVAFVNGRPVELAEVWTGAAEGMGGRVLEEIVLDRELSRRARIAGFEIGDEELRAERGRLARALSRGDLGEEQVGAILDRLRADRGLGPSRYEALLRRNAILRRLVAPDIEIDESEVALAYQIVFGERLEARLIVVAGDREAARLRAELEAGEGELSTRFAQAARRSSIDPSGEFGGAIEPISPVDPLWPDVLREALSRTPAGRMTPVLSLDGAYAIALVEQRLEPEDTSFEVERSRLERVLRERAERTAMATLAERIVRETEIEILDRSLAWSWEQRGP